MGGLVTCSSLIFYGMALAAASLSAGPLPANSSAPHTSQQGPVGEFRALCVLENADISGGDCYDSACSSSCVGRIAEPTNSGPDTNSNVVAPVGAPDQPLSRTRRARDKSQVGVIGGD